VSRRRRWTRGTEPPRAPGRFSIDQLRVFALGVEHDYRHSGVAAALPQAPRDGARPGTIEGGEIGWILETNKPMNRALEGMGGKVVKNTGCSSSRWPARS
jgi:hypothetical protein